MAEKRAAWARYMRAWLETDVGRRYVTEHTRTSKKRYWATEKGKRMMRLAQKRYHQSPRGRAKNAVMCANGYARRRGALGSHTAAEWTGLRRSYRGLCVYCLGKATTRDHLVSLERGGTNFIDNIVPACVSCNSSKQDTPFLVWLARRAAA